MVSAMASADHGVIHTAISRNRFHVFFHRRRRIHTWCTATSRHCFHVFSDTYLRAFHFKAQGSFSWVSYSATNCSLNFVIMIVACGYLSSSVPDGFRGLASWLKGWATKPPPSVKAKDEVKPKHSPTQPIRPCQKRVVGTSTAYWSLGFV